MHYPSYPFDQSEDNTQFFFESVGPKGVIQKVIIFSAIEENAVYNLALGDYDPATGDLDDKSVSDNGDTIRLLATIFNVTYHYLSVNPDHLVYFRGNTPARNRLYRMAINQAKEELSTYFAMFGSCHGSWEYLESDHLYEAFLIRKK